jgi:TetR/AcrR family transcriptional regulator, transcriptional repressor for nem operon
MRYEKGHKEITRHRIIETAAARFRRDGIDGVGVADLMGEAGLTHGGFYSHFSSKEELVRAAVELSAERGRAKFCQRVAEAGLEGWIRHYLRPGHRDHPERGCMVAALGGELARHPAGTRSVFGKKDGTVMSELIKQLPAAIPAARRRQVAVGVFAVMVGALQLARLTRDETASVEILEAGIAAALALAGLQPAATTKAVKS